jgi:catechol 2,3-dioxygenase-like lactoylglutathione lyase family enzyme
MITGIHHAGLSVGDMDRAVDFFENVLGLEKLNDRDVQGSYVAEVLNDPRTHMRIVFFKVGEDLLELVQYKHANAAPTKDELFAPGMAHICLTVDDIHSVYERIKAAGVNTRNTPTLITHGPNKGGYALMSYDPDGHWIELMQRPPAGTAEGPFAGKAMADR